MVVKFNKLTKNLLDIPLTKVSGVWESFFTQISIVWSNGMLINRPSASKLAMKRSLFWVENSSTKVKKSLTLNSFCNVSDRTGTKNITNLYVGVPIAERMNLNGGILFLRC